MGNIAITPICNHACSYCFAQSASKTEPDDSDFMSPALFNKSTDFLLSSDIKNLNILGGEPTLHPHFINFCETAFKKFDSITIFTNGDMTPKVRAYLETVPESRITILINLTDCSSLMSSVKKTMQILGQKAMAGVTVYRPDMEFAFLLKHIETFGLKNKIRIGLAHPGSKDGNNSLSPRSYFHVGRNILYFAEQAQQKGVTLIPDCGFVPCMFNSSDPSLLETNGQPMGLCCGPIPDILHNGTIIHCYPCHSYGGISLSQVTSLSEAKKKLAGNLMPFSQIGLFKECNACKFRLSGECLGGCRGTALKRIHQAHFTISTDISCNPSSVKAFHKDSTNRHSTHGNLKRWSIPYVDQPMAFWKNLTRHYNEHVKEVYLPLECEGLGSGRPQQPDRYTTEFLTSSVIPVSLIINPIVLPSPVEKIAPAIQRALAKTMAQTQISSVTLANVTLAAKIKEWFPDLSLTASVLMDISSPEQLPMLENFFDTIVVSGRIMRSLPELETMHKAWKGKLRMIVNEGCLPGCVYRTQHFFEMSSNLSYPKSLCTSLLDKKPWLSLTGSWVLPQHLHLFDCVIDEYKLDGRVTLQDDTKYIKVLDAFINKKELMPHETGGGPASCSKPLEITEYFYKTTLTCNKDCNHCTICRDHFHCLRQ